MTSSAVDEVQMQVDTNYNQEFESQSDNSHQQQQSGATPTFEEGQTLTSAAVEESICRTSAFLSLLIIRQA